MVVHQKAVCPATVVAVALSAVASVSAPGNAAILYSSDELGSGAVTIDFESIPEIGTPNDFGVPVTNQYSSLGVLFSSESRPEVFESTDPQDVNERFNDPLLIFPSVPGGGSPASGSRYAGGTHYLNYNVSDMRIDFLNPVSAVGMYLIDNDFSVGRISAYDSVGNLLESAIFPQVGEGGRGYRGIAARNISYVIVDANNGGVLDSSFIDDVSFVQQTSDPESVPEPTTGLVLGGLAAASLLRKNRKSCK